MKHALLLAGLLALSPAAAQVSERPDSVRVTVYHSASENDPTEFRDPEPDQGLAFITETRTIDVPSGPATIELRGVASTIIPQTVAVDGLPVPLTERNFDYDLLSPASLLAKSVGETVTLIRTDKKTGKKSQREAIIRTGANGVVLDFGGSYEALGCSGLKESLVFSKIPEGLRDTPSLSISTNAPAAGRYTVKLSYLATDVNWGANYVARLLPGGDRLDLNGWVTVVNAGDTSFKDVPLDIVAGTVQRVEEEDHGVAPRRAFRTGQCWPTNVNWMRLKRTLREAIQADDIGRFPDAIHAPALQRASDMSLETVMVTGMRASRDLGDYKLYSLNGTTDISAHQTKLVQLLEQNDVPFQRVYYFVLGQDEEQRTVSVALRMKNTKLNHLGLALPAGMFTATEVQANGAPIVLGRSNFRDFAVDSPIELEVGKAFDIYVQMKTAGDERVIGRGNDRWRQASGEVVIENQKTIAVDFELRLPVSDELRIVSESERHTVTPNGMVWAFRIAAGKKKPLRLTIERKE